MIIGTILAITEVGLIFIFGNKLKNINNSFNTLDLVSFYWLLFTAVTGIWELSFILHYNTTCNNAELLIKNNEHVWTNYYSLINLLPHKFALLFYSEYGAYADREYMLVENNWSRIIEGSHCIFCGLGALLSLIAIGYSTKTDTIHYFKKKQRKYKISKYYYIFCSSAMSSQAMNSILYIVNYFHETRDPYNINYNSTSFPTGIVLNNRPFMYVNIFWTIMPLYVLLRIIFNI